MKKLLLLSFALLAFMACDLEELVDEIEDSLSSFDATVTGAVTTSFSGNAEFINSSVESQSPQGSVLFLYLTNENDPDEEIQISVTISNVTGGVTAGTYEYDINNTDLVVFGFYYSETNVFQYPDPTSTNRVTLTKVEENSIEGTYEFNITNNILDGEKVTISGSFKALGVTETI